MEEKGVYGKVAKRTLTFGIMPYGALGKASDGDRISTDLISLVSENQQSTGDWSGTNSGFVWQRAFLKQDQALNLSAEHVME